MGYENMRKRGILAIVAIIMIAALAQTTVAQELPVVIMGTVTYVNGTFVPYGWTVSVENLDEALVGEPWTGTTGYYPPMYNYSVMASRKIATPTLQVTVSSPDGEYTGSNTGMFVGVMPLIINVTVVKVQDTTPPSVTNPTATPSSIPADGTTPSQLNVTVTDDSGVASVTIDLSAIGGSAAQVMSLLGDNVYSTTTTASVGTPPGTYNLQVNATDIYGNSNTSVSIPLTVGPTVSIYTDKTVYYRGDTMHVGLNVTNPGSDDLPVRFAVWLEDTKGDTHKLLFTSLTLPTGLEYTNPDFAVFTLPGIPSGTYTWHAALIEPYGPIEFISHDTAEWEFAYSMETETPTEDITTVLEQITVVIDFG